MGDHATVASGGADEKAPTSPTCSSGKAVVPPEGKTSPTGVDVRVGATWEVARRRAFDLVAQSLAKRHGGRKGDASEAELLRDVRELLELPSDYSPSLDDAADSNANHMSSRSTRLATSSPRRARVGRHKRKRPSKEWEDTKSSEQSPGCAGENRRGQRGRKEQDLEEGVLVEVDAATDTYVLPAVRARLCRLQAMHGETESATGGGTTVGGTAEQSTSISPKTRRRGAGRAGGAGSPASDSETSEGETEAEAHNEACDVCNECGELLMCDTCTLVFHPDCHRPKLKKLPGRRETWSCSHCVADGSAKGNATAARRHVAKMRMLEVQNRSTYRGVSRRGDHFRAQIQIHGVLQHLGNFSTAVEAAREYDTHAASAFGDKAVLNFPQPKHSDMDQEEHATWDCILCRDDDDVLVCQGCGCQVCNGKNDMSSMLCCIECNALEHTFCATPPLQTLPTESWKCRSCTSPKKINDKSRARTRRARSSPPKRQRDDPSSKATCTHPEDPTSERMTEKGLALVQAMTRRILGDAEMAEFDRIVRDADRGALVALRHRICDVLEDAERPTQAALAEEEATEAPRVTRRRSPLPRGNKDNDLAVSSHPGPQQKTVT